MSAPATAHVRIDPAFTIGPVNRRLFGTFVEHLGRCVYTGLYEPDHPSADEHGFRRDVDALVDELGATIVRYPGGNFVSGYRWEDGVGPRENRPRRTDLAWRSIESNQIGTDEFLQWAARRNLEPLMAVNLGTRGLVEAVELAEYCNGPAGTEVADRRVGNGHADPYGVTWWCLGNEMDGPWQTGHKTAYEYGRLAAETATALHQLDPTLRLVACGSSNRGMSTFADWEREVLQLAWDQVELISAHAYYEPHDGDVASFLASAEDMDRFIRSVVATADHVAASRKSDKRIGISFDEWNVWRAAEFGAEMSGELAEAPRLIEDVYDVHDAVVVGSLLATLLSHTDRVGIACQAQLVNVIAPIMTDPGGSAWRQTIFHPFALTSRHARGTVLRPAVDSPVITTGRYGEVDQLQVSVTRTDAGEQCLVLINRSVDTAVSVRVTQPASVGLVEHQMIFDDDPHATNTAEHPDRVVPRAGNASIVDGALTADLPPASWHLVRLTEQPD